MKKTYYYSDEINDDFAGTNIKRKELPADYPYFSSNPVRKFFEFILYRLIVTPLIFLFQKIVFREKFKNKKVLKKYRKNGYFIYANHTSAVSDAFTPTLVTFPKKAYILINPDGVSIPVVGKAVEMLGGVPLPTHRRGMKNFHDAVLSHAQKRHCIVIYPEAHIWPYYTKIRPFKDVSFRYPAEADKPSFVSPPPSKRESFSNVPKKRFMWTVLSSPIRISPRKKIKSASESLSITPWWRGARLRLTNIRNTSRRQISPK